MATLASRRQWEVQHPSGADKVQWASRTALVVKDGTGIVEVVAAVAAVAIRAETADGERVHIWNAQMRAAVNRKLVCHLTQVQCPKPSRT
jgi:hypothetical protein